MSSSDSPNSCFSSSKANNTRGDTGGRPPVATYGFIEINSTVDTPPLPLPCGLLPLLPREILGRLRIGPLPQRAPDRRNLALLYLHNRPPDAAVHPRVLGAVTVDGVAQRHDGTGYIGVEGGRVHVVGNLVLKLLLDRGFAHTGRHGTQPHPIDDRILPIQGQ